MNDVFAQIVRPKKATGKRLALKPVEGLTFVDTGIGGKPHPDAMKRLDALWKKYPQAKLRKGQKGAAQLLKESRDRR